MYILYVFNNNNNLYFTFNINKLWLNFNPPYLSHLFTHKVLKVFFLSKWVMLIISLDREFLYNLHAYWTAHVAFPQDLTCCHNWLKYWCQNSM